MRPLAWVCLKQANRLLRQGRLIHQQCEAIEILASANADLRDELDHEANRADALYLIADRTQRDSVIRVLDQLATLPEAPR